VKRTGDANGNIRIRKHVLPCNADVVARSVPLNSKENARK